MVSIEPGVEVPRVLRPRSTRRPLRTVLLLAVMTAIAAVMLYPFWWMVDTSLKSNDQFLHGGGHSLASWTHLNDALPWKRQLLNSTVVCVASIAVILVVSTLAGFSFAKLRYRAATFVFVGIIAAMLIPIQSIIIPAYINLANWHLLNSYYGAVLVYAALGTPFATFLMTAYFRGLPDDVIEAGIVDGLSYLAVFRRIALPMAVPAIVTVAVLQFIQIWDDLLVGLLLLQDPDQRTITVGLGALAAGRTTDIPVLMAGSILSAIPAIVVYLVFQRFLVNGLTAGMGK
jgi:multiple sugar transport system permease protein/raffinose/stachyose/melibiose transport system permease protein